MRAYSSVTWPLLAAAVAVVASAGASCAKGTVSIGIGGAGGSVLTGPAGGTGGKGGADGGDAAGGGGMDGGVDGPVACLHKSDCAAVMDACNDGSCVDNVCVQTPINEGGSCDDGLYCTDGDTCTMGVCTGTPIMCMGADPCHVSNCDEPTKMCTLAPGNDGATCSPTDMCFLSGFCSSGTCLGSTPQNCSFLNDQCNIGTCDPVMGCVKTPNNGGLCFDGSFCSVNKTCMNGVCAGGTPVVCPPSTTQCVASTCVEGVHPCELGPAADGTACTTMNPCVTQEACTAGTCVGGVPASEGAPCMANNACVTNAKCTMGLCSGTTIMACVNNDSCCPVGCTSANDNDCNCNVNLALAAVGTTSGGGSVPPYTPAEMNNGIGESNCGRDSWISNGSSPTGAWWELDWPSAVTIGSMYIEAPDIGGMICADSGRNIGSADVQTWNGSTWVTAMSFSGKSGNIQLNLPAPVVTTKLRLYNVTANSSNSIMFEWHVFAGVSCIPPAD